jgi:hypothetical protein
VHEERVGFGVLVVQRAVTEQTKHTLQRRERDQDREREQAQLLRQLLEPRPEASTADSFVRRRALLLAAGLVIRDLFC